MADLPEALPEDLFTELTDRQRRVVPVVLAAPTISAGLDAAEVSKSTWYRWRRDPTFRDVLVHLHNESIRESLSDLSGGCRYAVRGLLGLMTSANEHIKLQACRDVVNLTLKAHELLSLDDRLERLERALAPLSAAAQVH